MEEISEGHFTQALKRGREGLNARFAYARRMNRTLDPASFAHVLQTAVAPIVEQAGAASGGDPQKIDRVLDGLYGTALDLTAQGYLGPSPRSPLVPEVWRTLLMALVPFLLQSPARIAASFSNAAVHFDQCPEADGKKWIDLVCKLSAACTNTEELLDLGLVLSWRCGMAHFRQSALAVWRRLPGTLKALSLGFAVEGGPIPDEESMERALEDPWRLPGDGPGRAGQSELALVAQAGGFRGFGGCFGKPPQVGAAGGQLYAWDEDACWSIHADCFGATLRKHGAKPPESMEKARGPAGIAQGGAVTLNGLEGAFELLASATGQATDGRTLAVTLRSSHKVFLIAPVQKGPQ